MFKNLAGARLGLFIFLGTVLFALGIFLIGDKGALFSSTFNVTTHFKNIEGLRTGAAVRLSGLDIGSVKEISLITDSTQKVKVVLSIREDVKHFIRLDSKAIIETEGLIGAKIISVTPGNPDFEIVQDGGFIYSEEPINIGAIFKESQGTIENISELSGDFSEIIAKVNEGKGTIGKLINDEELYNSTVNITKSADRTLNKLTEDMASLSKIVLTLGGGIERIINNVDSATNDVKSLMAKIDEGKGTLGALISERNLYDSLNSVMSNLIKTTGEAQKGARGFAENMEALKHNWLFKSYFEERGYWDSSEYENQIDNKIKEIDVKSKELDDKIIELKKLQKKISKK
ncbi:MAG: MCE family protein [Ignavibacteria bacterium]|nr:MCE family protein [Ignavibacteria bacterium]